jgi:hypothetical protein
MSAKLSSFRFRPGISNCQAATGNATTVNAEALKQVLRHEIKT